MSSIEERLRNMGLSSFADTIVCKDGFKVRVQAGKVFESLPKDNIGPWTHFEVEIDFDAVEPDLIPYGDISYHWGMHSNIYSHVPKEIVRKLIESHGGVRTLQKCHRISSSSTAYSLITFMILAQVFDRPTCAFAHPRYQKTGARWVCEPQKS